MPPCARHTRGLNGTSALTAAASATNAAEAEEITQDLAHGPRALPQSQTKGLCLVSFSLLRPLPRPTLFPYTTLFRSGRAEAPDARRGRTLSSSARGAQPPAHHGPFERKSTRLNFRHTVSSYAALRKTHTRTQRNFSFNRSRICDKRS